MYVRQVLIQSFQTSLILVFKSLVELIVPVLTPSLHVIPTEPLYKHKEKCEYTYIHYHYLLKCLAKFVILLLCYLCVLLFVFKISENAHNLFIFSSV